MAHYVVIAENYAKRAGRSEARTMGHVYADSPDAALRIAKAEWPDLKLTITLHDDRPPSTPRAPPSGS